MPMIRVATNLPNDAVPEDFELLLTNVLAEALSKPAERIFIEVQTQARLIHGASKDPTALIKIRSIGSISPELNIVTVKKVTELFTQKLNIPANKVIVEFYDLETSNVGFSGTTVAELRK